MILQLKDNWELYKFSLIDLETLKKATGGKRKQPERLSERTPLYIRRCDSLNIGITKEACESYPKR